MRKVKLYPTSLQKEKLRQAMGAYRWTYNQCVGAIKAKTCPANQTQLRAHFVNNSCFAKENTWALQIPYEIRDQAASDALGAFTSNWAKQAKGATALAKFDVGFKKKRAGFGFIKILAKAWRNGVFYPKAFAFGAFKSAEQLPPKLAADTSITLENGNYYINVPTLGSSRKPKEEDAIGKVCSIDPGVRCFATVYDPMRARVYKWGDGDKGLIYRLGIRLDDLIGRMAKETARRRYRMRIAANRLRTRIKNLVDDLHKKFARWLAVNYEHVLCPKFNAHQMSKRGARRIGCKTVRAMMTWAHGRFRTRLGWATPLLDCTEPYTTKACTECGLIKRDLGGAKVYRCDGCGAIADRDCSGARNNFLKALIEAE